MNALEDDPRAVARSLLRLADVLEARTAGVASYGFLRRAARMLVAIEVPAPDACPVCHGPVEQPDQGRRRVYCSDRCRRRAENQRRNGRVVA